MDKTIVKIEFEGLAACYKINNQWKMLFPHEKGDNKCHSIKYSKEEPNSPVTNERDLAKMNRKIDLIHVGSDGKPIEVELGEYPNSYLDFTGDYAHTDNLKQASIKLKKNWEKRAVELTMNSGKFFDGGGLEQFYFVLVENKGDRLVEVKKRFRDDELGVKLIAEIELKKDESLKLKITDKPDEVFEYIEGGGLYTLWFDNDCTGSPHESEYDLYYDLFEEVKEINKRYELYWIPTDYVDTDDYHEGKIIDLVVLNSRILEGRDKLPDHDSEDKTNPCGKVIITKPGGIY